MHWSRNIAPWTGLRLIPVLLLLLSYTQSIFADASSRDAPPPDALPPTVSLKEAPMLRSLVANGGLPPVSERVPAEPLVLVPTETTGTYGGTWRRLGVHPSDSLLGSRIGYESLVRWDRTGRNVVPGIAKSWEILDGAKRYVFHLRKGMKWSDGHPFTSDDLVFWYEDVVGNKEISPVFPSYWCPGGGTFTLRADGPHVVEFLFDEPNGIFLELMAFRGIGLYYPKHYLVQFHSRYQAKETLEDLAKAEGLDLWHQLFLQKANIHETPECPTLRAWVLKVGPPATRLMVERNPYYWKIDTEGNQLPYIDRIGTTIMQNKEVLNLKAITGGVDMQARYIDSSKFTLFMKNRKQGGYRVLADPSPSSTVVYLNQRSKNPAMRGVLCDPRFRRALSIAIDREELIELIYSGLAEPTNGVSSEFDPCYLPEFSTKHTEYAPQEARRLLDEVGLRRGRLGMRRMPDGSRFKQILHYYPAETGTGAELWQLVADYWREIGLEFVVKSDARTLSVMQVRNGNSDFWAYAIAGMHWITDAGWYVPIRDGAYFAPLYGRWVVRKGKSGVEPAEEFMRLLDWYGQLARTDSADLRLQLGRDILRQWANQCYIVGVVRRKEVTLVGNRMRNFPASMIQDYRLLAPGYLCPEQFFLEDAGAAK
ncbi:MAG: ABC transporter substrate-binding protein [Lentisphaerae bacterium]|nr:ABC transporter substrate-binding protein [Lentisphaerota bacterium]MBT7842782.1 ABC transporter substrate-binding protein [Lentisphaerota bacterium]